MINKTILIIDDDQSIRESLTQVLEYENYNVLTAIHGKNAIDILLNLPANLLPDLILLDMMMPIMDGQEFLKQMGENYKNQFGSIPIIAISAQMHVNVTGTNRPVAIVKKPMDIDDLFEIVEKYIKKD